MQHPIMPHCNAHAAPLKSPIAPTRHALRACLCASIVLMAELCSANLLAAAVPTEWTVRIGPRSAAYQAERRHGDALDLRATLTYNGQPLVYTGPARLYAQTNGMGSVWWDLAPCTVVSNTLQATWLPSFDAGADVVDLFLGGPSNYQAAARIRFLPSPGSVPNSLPLPAPTLDFSTVIITNAPFATFEELATATNEVLQAAIISDNAKRDKTDLGVYSNTVEFTEWTFTPSMYDGHPISMWTNYSAGAWWAPSADGFNIGLGKGDENSLNLSWTEDSEAQINITATRTQVIRTIPVPGKLSTTNDVAEFEDYVRTNLYTKAQTDEAIDKLAAYYITANARGDAFETLYALTNATAAYYSGGQARTLTRNDYAVVLADESHGGAEWRYIYAVAADGVTGQWEAQYPIETNDYDALTNRPQINGVTLGGSNNVASALGLIGPDAISTNNPAFVSAVLAAPLVGADEADVAEIAEYGGYGTVGAALLALIAGLAALKRRVGAAETALSGKAGAADLRYRIVTPGEWWTWADGEDHGQPVYYAEDPSTEEEQFDWQGAGWYLGDQYDVSAGPDATSLSDFEFSVGEGEDEHLERVTATRGYVLLDRASNRVTPADASALTLPAAVPGHMRDFYLEMSVTGSMNVAFSPSSGVVYTGFGDPSRIYPKGTYLLHFTETGENEFCVTDMTAQVPVATTEKAGVVLPDGTTVTVDANGVISAGGGGHVVKIQMDQNSYGSIVVNGSFTLDYEDLRFYAHGSKALLVLSDVTKIRINRNNNYTTCTIPLDTDVAVNADMAIVVNWTADCLSPDTEVRMADGTLKKVADVVAGDVVATPHGPDVVVSASTGRGGRRDTWRFDDGSYVVTVGRHRFWNCELGEPMYLEAWNAGEHALTADGRRVALVSRETESGEFAHATIFTERYNLYYAGGLLAGNRRSVKGDV